MSNVLSSLFNDEGGNLRAKVIGIYVLLIGANVATWLWALSAFRDYPILLGTAMLAYTFGLRHAFDADHIAAIDNVTRKLMQEGKRPVAVGFFFSLGHSTIVVLLSIAIALTATALQVEVRQLHQRSAASSARCVSAFFLFAIAIANILILISIYRTFQTVKSGGTFVEEDLDLMLSQARVLRAHLPPLVPADRAAAGTCIRSAFCSAWASTRRRKSACSASRPRRPPRHVDLVDPGVSGAVHGRRCRLIDTTDSILMLGAYGWAFVKPIRKLYYNMTITAVSVIVAVLVGGLEVLNLIGDQLGLTDGGGFWGAIGAINDNFGVLGYVIIGIFVLSWLGSVVFYNVKGYDDLEINTAGGG